MAVFSSDLPHVNKKYLRLCGLILTIGTVCGRFNFEVHVLRMLTMLTMWKSWTQMMMMMEKNYSLLLLQVSNLITPQLLFTSSHFQLPYASCCIFALWYCVDQKCAE